MARQSIARGAGTGRVFPVTAAALAALALLGGCASIPDITVSYRPVKWALVVTVAHTITCNRDNSLAVVERGAAYLPIYSAAAADPRFRIQLKALDRFYADADIALALTDDGRLKSINQSTTGQGETLVKSAIAAAATIAAVPAVPSVAAAASGGVELFSNNANRKRAASARSTSVCDVVRKWSLSAPDQLPQVSLVQTAVIKADSSGVVPAETSEDQRKLLDELKQARLDLSAAVTPSFAVGELQPIAEPGTSVASNEVPLTLQRMLSLGVAVSDVQGDIGSKSIPVPTKEIFVLPIPKAALFGKQSFSLALADSGRISSIGYGRTAGAPSVLGAVTAAAGAETTADTAEAAAMKAAADLIAQQQRFNTCKLKPSECK